jgi:GT2 family glycosyltransferase
MSTPPKVSVIIPTFNEIKLGFLARILERLATISELEIIVSDGGSTDGTLDLALDFQVNLIKANTSSRAQRLNLGAYEAKAPMLLFHHPRSLLDTKGIEFLKKEGQKLNWGGFTHRFDFDHPLLKFTSWYSNNVRAKISEIYYLDHCIFVKKALFEKVGPIPQVDIFEDTILSLRLKNRGADSRLLPYESLTSAIRFKERGIYKQAILNQFLKWSHYLNVDDKKLNRQYEDKLKLNANYELAVDEQEAPPRTQNSAQKG